MTTSEQKQKSEAEILVRMRQSQFKFSDLWMPYGADAPEYRQADRLIQRERKAGNIRMVKHGVWEWVDKGD